MYAATGGPNMKWVTFFKWGAGHHWPPRWRRPCIWPRQWSYMMIWNRLNTFSFVRFVYFLTWCAHANTAI